MEPLQLEIELLVQQGYELREEQTLSGSIAIQLPGVSCQMSATATAMTSCQLSDASPSSQAKAASAAAFSSVLSARMDRQGPTNESSRLTSSDAAGPEMVSSKKAGTAKVGSEKQNGADLAPA